MTKFKKPRLTHFKNLDTLSENDIYYLIEQGIRFRNNVIDKDKIIKNLTGRVITHLFFEPSTRTLNSFELAAKRLGALTLSPHLATSSTTKGESLIDTVQTFEAMGTDAIVIRHSENLTPDFIASNLKTNIHVINAGDGTNHHPSQALLDLMTIFDHKKNFTDLTVAIVGDINHSRVAHSLIIALNKVGAKQVRLVGPEELVDKRYETDGAKVFHRLKDGINRANVIIVLRIQKERFEKDEKLNIDFYQQHYCVTNEILKYADDDVIIMHPGPMNRNIEISSEVADSACSLILEQVRNGVAMRMAILNTLLTNH